MTDNGHTCSASLRLATHRGDERALASGGNKHMQWEEEEEEEEEEKEDEGMPLRFIN